MVGICRSTLSLIVFLLFICITTESREISNQDKDDNDRNSKAEQDTFKAGHTSEPITLEKLDENYIKGDQSEKTEKQETEKSSWQDATGSNAEADVDVKQEPFKVREHSPLRNNYHEQDPPLIEPSPVETPPAAINEMKKDDEYKKINDVYEEGMSIINNSHVWSTVIRGYQLLRDASKMGHVEAEIEIGFAYLFGIYLKQQIEAAKEIFLKHAKDGNTRAQAGLGFMYATGLGTNSSQAKALVYLTFSALGDDAMGRMMLGYRYWAGIGVPQSCETSLNHYRKVAEQVASTIKLTGGPLRLRSRLLDEEENRGNSYGRVDEDLIQYYQFLADKGETSAQVTLGRLNYEGSQGFEQDHVKAFEYFTRAADGGNADAQGYLGKIFAQGSEKIKQNNETALKYFKQATEQGSAVGQAGLGLMYLYGKGVKVDYEKAFKYFQASADQGWAEGQLHLGNMYFHGHGVQRDYKTAHRFFNLAAQNGHLLALYYLAKMHASGTGVVRTCRTAVELYKNVCERGRWSLMFEQAYSQYKAGHADSALTVYLLLAELGYEVAQSNVAYILDQGQSLILPNQTYTRALLHWERAATQGYPIARIKLGDYHYYGKGTDVDYEIAASHYKVATEQDKNAQAMFNLGYMHEQGLGMKRDIHLAKRHYDMAAEASPDAVAPVSLALMKIGFLFALEFLQNQRWLHTSSISRFSLYLPEEWDLYLMTVLALMLGFVLAYRRQMR
ncbi:protein sel-1 homolog 1-like isoform X1 [Clavelina lepadiformis]|uniref:protein sel-1 homolog 1-like isoform X1 n=1 Tax=Clavelina lepadiformis TaxID=159417 RepID=UPI004041A053